MVGDSSGISLLVIPFYYLLSKSKSKSDTSPSPDSPPLPGASPRIPFKNG
jgi:hypothetical protein